MDILPFMATFFVALLSSILSELAGGGGGFIMAPYWLLAGMTPAQGATTGAFTALGMGASSLAAYRGSGHMPHRKRLITALLSVTLAASCVGPFFLQHVSTAAFKPVIALMTVVSLPFLFINKRSVTVSPNGRRAGLSLIALILLASSFVTSSAFSILTTVILTRTFDLTTLESTAVRRLIGIVQSAVIFVILVSLGNFLAFHGVTALVGGSVGSYFGTKVSLKKGETFAKYALAAGALASAVFLII